MYTMMGFVPERVDMRRSWAVCRHTYHQRVRSTTRELFTWASHIFVWISDDDLSVWMVCWGREEGPVGVLSFLAWVDVVRSAGSGFVNGFSMSCIPRDWIGCEGLIRRLCGLPLRDRCEDSRRRLGQARFLNGTWDGIFCGWSHEQGLSRSCP